MTTTRSNLTENSRYQDVNTLNNGLHQARVIEAYKSGHGSKRLNLATLEVNDKIMKAIINLGAEIVYPGDNVTLNKISNYNAIANVEISQDEIAERTLDLHKTIDEILDY